jgi:glutamine synthetase
VHPDTPEQDALLFIATCDLAARTRGRALRLSEKTPQTSTGWVAANLGIGALGHIVDGIPFGSSGDLRLAPDATSRIDVPAIGGRPAYSLEFANIVETDGRAWASCPRTFLRSALHDLRAEFGMDLTASFEHEFVDVSAVGPHHPFSLQALRNAEPAGSVLVETLARAGLEPENWLAEYGKHQYEITLAPTDPLTAADRAIALRELVGEVFHAHGRQASFAPVTAVGGTGNGVHVHFGLVDEDGQNVAFDADRPGRLSEAAERFAAGILRHARGMTAMFAPLLTSYARLVPHNWSAARAVLGVQNREALVRIPPTNEIDGRDPSNQLHFEFRGSDVGANPWILLGMLVRAGLEGLRDPDARADVLIGEIDLDAELPQLPSSLHEALEAFEADKVVQGWFAPELIQTFQAIKRDEIERLEPLSPDAQCEVYRDAY